MRKSLKKVAAYLEKFIKFFNFAFFLLSLLIWIYLTVVHLLSEPFQLALLWAAFNDMYAQLAFKLGCIVLIIGNGLQTIQNLIGQYSQIKEYHGHFSTLGKLIKGKK